MGGAEDLDGARWEVKDVLGPLPLMFLVLFLVMFLVIQWFSIITHLLEGGSFWSPCLPSLHFSHIQWELCPLLSSA